MQLLPKQTEINWFRNARTAARAHDSFVISYHRVRRYGDHRDVSQLGIATDPGSERQTVLSTELHVQQHRLRRLALEDSKGFVQSRGGLHLEFLGLQPVHEEFEIRRVVFDHENSMAHIFSTSAGGATRCS